VDGADVCAHPVRAVRGRHICHCKSAEEARALWSAIADRLAACKLVLHPEKTKIVYCKDVNRRADFPNIHFDFLGYQFRARKIMWVKADRRIFAHSFQPAVSPKALARISGISAAGRFIIAATSP
jgi:RNA-directed DNA polymerase